MKIHSDILTPRTIFESVPSRCFLATFDHDGQWVDIAEAGSRKRSRAYVVRLSGSSRYAMASGHLMENYKSATWDEWGNFIAAMFRIDPSAIIGDYKGVDDFIAQTQAERDRCAQFRPDLHRLAPWLDDDDLIFMTAR